jgi:LysR family cyn operon transcriptional activator
MELRQLRYYLKVVETLSFTRAAALLHITQPTLSQQIGRLERETGRLFNRSRRSVELSDQGRVFRRYAERAIQELEAGLNELAARQRIVRGQLAIGVFRSYNSSRLPRILTRYSERNPQVRLVVREVPHVETERGLIDGSLDLAVGYEPALSRKIVSETIFSEPLVLIVGKTHPLGTSRRVALEALERLPLVLVNRETRSRQLIDRCLAEHGVSPNVVMEVNSNDAALATVRCGRLATISTVQSLAGLPDLHAVSIPDPALQRRTGILWCRNSTRSAAATLMASMIRADYEKRSRGSRGRAAAH